MASAKLVCGIECQLRDLKAVRVADRVLRQIQDRRPKDFDRLKNVVHRIVPLSKETAQGGTLGETKHLAPGDDLSTWSWGLAGGPVEIFHLLRQAPAIGIT